MTQSMQQQQQAHEQALQQQQQAEAALQSRQQVQQGAPAPPPARAYLREGGSSVRGLPAGLGWFRAPRCLLLALQRLAEAEGDMRAMLAEKVPPPRLLLYFRTRIATCYPYLES